MTRVGVDEEERESLCIADVNVIGSVIVENSIETCQKMKNRTTILSNNPSSGCIVKGK